MAKDVKPAKGRVNASTATPQPPAVEDKGSVLRVNARAGVSDKRQLADLATDGIATNAIVARTFLGPSQPNIGLTELVASLKDHGQRVNANDMTAQEQMLTAQSMALNAIFGEMARRSALNLGQHLEATERYMRLALKAQGQCRATLETLAAIKNPPVLFARQANINNGGQQQVNNEALPGQAVKGQRPAPAHEEIRNRPNELLEDLSHGGTQLDTRATSKTGGPNPRLEPMASIHRAEDR